MEKQNIPQEQLQAIADFWADRYLLEKTPNQLEIFKANLKKNVLEELQNLPWYEHDPEWGSYLRKFVTAHDYHPSPVLRKSLEAANLKSNILAFIPAVLSIDPGSVKTHPHGEIIWQLKR